MNKKNRKQIKRAAEKVATKEGPALFIRYCDRNRVEFTELGEEAFKVGMMYGSIIAMEAAIKLAEDVTRGL